MALYAVPRSFALRQELEFAEKGVGESKSDPNKGFISFGLGAVGETGFDKPEDYSTQLNDWSGTIIGPQSTHLGDRIFSVKITPGKDYPARPPQVKFLTKINMPCVDQQTGDVSPTWYPKWNSNNNIYDFLVSLRNEMVAASKLPQPPAGSEY
mmetsp:Transcript_10363/g.15008  ORF Transcript_10363/g.15008 Transcript_10363/m.15008 type:complete len:153 (-) Transcript_10363:272-730(-)